MKLYNIVFSPTGGTKKVADCLTGALEGDVTTVDLTDSKQDLNTVSLTKEDAAVISVPSYGGRVPAVAAERLGVVHGNGARAILVCVYGNRAYEDTLVELEDAAKQAGFQVIAAIAAIAEHSIARQFAAGRPDAQDIAQLSDFAKQIQHKLSEADTSEPAIPGNRPYKKPAESVWYPKRQKSVPTAVPVQQRVPYRPSTKKIPKRWMKKRVSPVCAVSQYVPMVPARPILSCSLRPA